MIKFGFQLPTGREGLSLPAPFFRPQDFLAFSVTAELLGYDSLWGNDHITPPNYVKEHLTAPANLYDVLTSLAAVAAVTHTIKLGTAALIFSMHDLISVARQASTIDQISNGRVILGVGLGNYKEEMVAAYPERAGKNRRVILEEGLELLNHLWNDKEVTFDGVYYKVHGLRLDPKPLQKPLPIYIGGHHHNTIDRTVRYGQGWIPGWEPFEELRENIRQLREKAAAVGRNPASIVVAPHLTMLVARTQEEAEERYLNSGVVRHRLSMGHSKDKILRAIQYNLIGCPDNVLEKVSYLEEIGVDHLASLSLAVDSVGEFSEQVHMFAEAIVWPYRKRWE
jgi:probable F420-dependent oxidoreductase